jgi:hypothetical protein
MTDEQIIAYVDGELGPLEALRFERAIEGDPALGERVERHRAVRERISARFAPVADEPVPARLAAMLGGAGDTVVPLPVRRKAFLTSGGGRYAALAATLVAGLVLGQLLPGGSNGPIGERGGAVVAQAGLARALDTQLASAQPEQAAWRIGTSFRSRDGRYCRSFEGSGGAGLGCHGQQGWTVERFVAGAPAGRGGGYAQAASPSADILAAAQDMMAGDPLDAAAEKVARDGGWQVAR